MYKMDLKNILRGHNCEMEIFASLIAAVTPSLLEDLKYQVGKLLPAKSSLFVKCFNSFWNLFNLTCR